MPGIVKIMYYLIAFITQLLTSGEDTCVRVWSIQKSANGGAKVGRKFRIKIERPSTCTFYRAYNVKRLKNR